MQYFSVKNFEKFQHYKHRNPPWIKLYNSLIDDYQFAGLPDESKAHLILIYLLASRFDNKIPYDPVWVANRIGASSPVNLDLLTSCGFLLASCKQRASKTLADCKQSALPEREKRQSRERDREETEKIAPAALAPVPVAQEGLLPVISLVEPLEAKNDFQAFYDLYPRKKARDRALKAWKAAIKRTTPEKIMTALRLQLAAGEFSDDPTKRPYPASWLNAGCWSDEITGPAPARLRPADKVWTIEEVELQLEEARRINASR